MKAQEDKALENIVDKMMQETVMELPSLDFTSQVMNQVEAIQSSEITKYKPLISKPIWSIFGFAILATCFYLFLKTPANEFCWLSRINFDVITNNSIAESVSRFKISKTLMYTIVFLSLMICVQVPLLKSYFDKQFES